MQASLVCIKHLVKSDEDEGCSSVDNAGSGRKGGVRSAVPDGLADTPEFASMDRRRTGAVRFRVN